MAILSLTAKALLALLCLICLIALIEYKRPFTKALLYFATPRLKALKDKSISEPSPFENTDSTKWIAESPNAYALKDIRPRAPHHYLVIPKQRNNTLLEAEPELLSEMLALCKQVAIDVGIADDGFRVVINTNPQGLQTVYHLHMHVIGGRQLSFSIG
jgi:histidine triad (HIT) family protein